MSDIRIEYKNKYGEISNAGLDRLPVEIARRLNSFFNFENSAFISNTKPEEYYINGKYQNVVVDLDDLPFDLQNDIKKFLIYTNSVMILPYIKFYHGGKLMSLVLCSADAKLKLKSDPCKIINPEDIRNVENIDFSEPVKNGSVRGTLLTTDGFMVYDDVNIRPEIRELQSPFYSVGAFSESYIMDKKPDGKISVIETETAEVLINNRKQYKILDSYNIAFKDSNDMEIYNLYRKCGIMLPDVANFEVFNHRYYGNILLFSEYKDNSFGLDLIGRKRWNLLKGLNKRPEIELKNMFKMFHRIYGDNVWNMSGIEGRKAKYVIYEIAGKKYVKSVSKLVKLAKIKEKLER